MNTLYILKIFKVYLYQKKKISVLQRGPEKHKNKIKT